MAELNVSEIKDEEIVYGCAFDIDFDRCSWNEYQVVHAKCKPVKGMVMKSGDNKLYDCFYLLKKDGTPRESGKVYCTSRRFARTYEESVEIYNGLVREKMEKLRSIADKLEQELLQVGE